MTWESLLFHFLLLKKLKLRMLKFLKASQMETDAGANLGFEPESN